MPTRKKKIRIFPSFLEELTIIHLCESVYHHSPTRRAGKAVITWKVSALVLPALPCRLDYNWTSDEDDKLCFPEERQIIK